MACKLTFPAEMSDIELLKDIKLLVDHARVAKPSIKIALGNVRQHDSKEPMRIH